MRIFVLLALLWSGLGVVPALASPDPIPEPPLEGLEEAVRQRLTDAREALVAAVAAGELDDAELAELYGNTGMVFNAHHSFEVAEVCYRNAMNLAPENLRWPYVLGFLYQDTGRFEEALAAYLRVLEIAPADPLGSLRTGEVLVGLYRLLEAKPHFEVALGQPDLRAAALAGLAKIDMAADDLESAVARYREAIELQPSADQLYYPLSLALRKLGRTDEAQEAIQLGGRSKVEARDARLGEVGELTVSSEMFMTSGARAIKAGRLDEAAKSFRGAIAARPENARAYLNLAVVLRQQGDLEAAAANARRALELQEGYFFGHLNLGEILEEQGDLEGARVEYLQALEIDPSHVKGNLQMAALLMREGEPRGAVSHLESVIERAPALVPARYLLVLAWLAEGDVTRARTVVDEALAVHPDEPKVREMWIRVVAIDPAASDADVERALREALTQQRNEPTFGGAESLAMALAAAGRFEEAIRLQSRLIEQLPPTAAEADRTLLESNLSRYQQRLPPGRAWP